MRERTTWQGNGRMATSNRRAAEEGQDIYSMNYDGPRPQPKATDYENGSPADWAETPVSAEKMSVNAEYEGGHVKRNEIGLGEFREDTHKRPKWGEGKYDNARLSSERKATAAHRLASALLRTEDRAALRKVATGFMGMSDGALVSALNAVEATSPAALSDESRFKRALACTKIAAKVLGEGADEPVVERLARAMYNIDDPTLKSIVSIVATAQLAAEGESAKSEGKSSKAATAKKEGSSELSSESGESGESKKAAAAKAGKSGKSEESGHMAAGESKKGEKEAGGHKGMSGKHGMSDKHGMSAHSSKHMSGQAMGKMHMEKKAEECYSGDEGGSSDMGLDSEHKDMMAQMMPPAEGSGESAPMPAPAPAGESMGKPVGESMGKSMPAPAPMGMGQMAMSISFEDDGEPMQVHTAALEALFSDDPEVKAQRELTAAAKFNPARVASTGAKKLGSVRATPAPAPEASLAALWDRP